MVAQARVWAGRRRHCLAPRRFAQGVVAYRVSGLHVAVGLGCATPVRQPSSDDARRPSTPVHRGVHGQRSRCRILRSYLLAYCDRETSSGYFRPGFESARTMNIEQLFSAWAPPESPWSAWAKPVLFAHAPLSATYGEQLDLPNIDGFPRSRETAVVIDVEGAQS